MVTKSHIAIPMTEQFPLNLREKMTEREIDKVNMKVFAFANDST
jgi:hypothetical protein